MFSGSQHATVPAVGTAAYEPVKGFSPITYLFNSVVVLTVPADSPAKTMDELHEWGRKKQGGLTFGTPGLGSPSHLLGAKILLADKVPFEKRALSRRRADDGGPRHRPRRLVLADAVDVARASSPTSKLRALALDADERWDRLPDVPTLGELGFGKERVASWFALAGPAGMPPALVSRIRELFIQASKDPELQRRLGENGTPIVSSTPEEMGRAMAQEWETMQALAKTLNLRQP